MKFDIRRFLNIRRQKEFKFNYNLDGFGGVVVSMLASDTRVHGFKPGPSRWKSFGHLKKIPPHAFLRKGSERICPMSQLCGM